MRVPPLPHKIRRLLPATTSQLLTLHFGAPCLQRTLPRVSCIPRPDGASGHCRTGSKLPVPSGPPPRWGRLSGAPPRTSPCATAARRRCCPRTAPSRLLATMDRDAHKHPAVAGLPDISRSVFDDVADKFLTPGDSAAKRRVSKAAMSKKTAQNRRREKNRRRVNAVARRRA